MSKNNITKKQIPLLIFLTIMFAVIFYSSGITDSIQKFFTRTSDVSTIEIMNEITTLQEAKGKAIESAARFPHRAILIDDQTVERSYGWFFAFAPEKYIETGEMRYQVPGSPFIFVGRNGETEGFPSSATRSFFVDEYDRMYEAGELDNYLNNL